MQIHKMIETYLAHGDKEMPPLKLRFAEKISGVFNGDSSNHNPSYWIHIGHGQKENSIELLPDLEDWEDEEFETIPGISDGEEDCDYICVRELSNTIAKMKGKLIFVGLPICYAKQVGDELSNSNCILGIHARIRFGVSESLEFYDSDAKKILKPYGLVQWNDWVNEIYNAMILAVRKIVLEDD